MPRPQPLTITLAALACGGAAVVSVLARFWGANAGYADRFLVLVGAGWVAWKAIPGLKAAGANPTRAGWVPFVAGAVAFPIGWFLQAQVAPRALTLWWLAVAWLAAAVGVALLAGGWGHLRRLAFPLAFVLFALPIPNRVLVPLQHHLQSATTAAAEAVLPWVGVPVERHGFVLALPGGDLGVAEACSGVRSVTALTAIAAFVSHLYGFGPARGVLLVALTVPVIAAVNAARVVATGLIQEHAGARFIQGDWHEALGVAMVFVGLGAVLLLAKAVGGRKVAAAPEARPETEGRSGTQPLPNPSPLRGGAKTLLTPPSRPGKGAGGLGDVLPAAVLLLAAVATAGAQLLGRGAEAELVASAPLDDIPRTLGPWTGHDAPIPDFIPEMLTYDRAIHRAYTTGLGYEANVWVIFWSSQGMVKGYHHPDICLPGRGANVAARGQETLTLPGGRELRVTVREVANGRDRTLVHYWTQEGRRVWTADDEDAARTTGDSHRWVGERLFGRRREPTGRLVVLVGTPMWGDARTIRTQTAELSELLAAEVYRICPWADVRGTPPDRQDH